MKLILESLTAFGSLSLHFACSLVSDLEKEEMAKVREMWQLLGQQLEMEMPEPIVIPHIPAIARSDGYPVLELAGKFQAIANLIEPR